MKENQEHHGIYVEQAKDNNDLRYMITENGIPIQDACLWLDFISMNSYLTGERYAYALLRYFRFLRANGLQHRYVVSKAVIEEYIKNLLGLEEKVINIEGQLTFNALSTHLTVIKSFYHWLEDEHRVTANPATFSSKRTKQSPLMDKKLLYGQVWKFDIEETVLSRVTYLRKRNHLKWYSKSEIQSICSELHSLRNETIFVISIETGMRIGEILGLKINHFDPFELSLEVVKQQNIENKAQAKTTERTLFIPESLSEMIQTYISTERDEANILDSSFLFLNGQGPNKGKPLRSRNFLRILKDAGERAGLDKQEIRTHSGRSTRVQQLVELMREYPEVGITKAFIEEELGWRSSQTIKTYEKGYSASQKRKIMERIQPIVPKGQIDNKGGRY